MQTIQSLAPESFSPDLSLQAAQKAEQSGSPRESDFLFMLNQASRQDGRPSADEAPPQKSEAVSEKAGEEKPAPKEAAAFAEEGRAARPDGEGRPEKAETPGEGSGEKVAKAGKEKNGAKKAPAEKKAEPKVDAFIQGALEQGGKKSPPVQEADEGKKGAAARVLKTASGEDGGQKKIDPKQLDFLRKISERQNGAEEEKAAEKGAAEKFALDALDGGRTAEALLGEEGLELAAAARTRVPEAAEALLGAAENHGKKAGGGDFVPAKRSEKKPAIGVTDLRTKTEAPAAQKIAEKDGRKNFAAALKETAKGSVEMTLDVNSQTQKDILSLDGQSAASDGSTFQAMLKNQISQNAGDFVRAGNIVLRDNNQGQINLVLHPESLGNVKISMEMNGKSVVGRITVQSREALEAFSQSAGSLREAFIQSGFEDASFDVSFAGSQMQFARGQADDSGGRSRQGRKFYGEFAQESLTSVQEISDTVFDDDVSVNIVA